MQFKKLSYAKYYAGILFRNWTGKKNHTHSMAKISWSSNCWGKLNHLLILERTTGFCFQTLSSLRKKGARGLCVEPSRKSFRKLKLNHLFHRKVRCIHGAASSQSGYLYLKEQGYESTLSQVHSDASLDSTKVQAFTLDELIRGILVLIK